MQFAARRGSSTLQSPCGAVKRPTYLEVAKGSASAPRHLPRNKPMKSPGLPADASFVDHLHAMKRQEDGVSIYSSLNKIGLNGHFLFVLFKDENDGPFDFRSILKKSNFAPTESLRRRKGASTNRPIPRIIRSQASNDEPLVPNIVYNDDSVIEL